MKFHVLSDLHTEFADFTPPATDADVVVLAGDIGVGLGGVEWAALHFQSRPVIYVPGNHEHYHRDIGSVDDSRAAAPNNVHVLNDSALEVDGVRTLGQLSW